MSLVDVRRRKDKMYDISRSKETAKMAHSKRSNDVKAEAYKLFACDLNNLEIVSLLGISYTEVLSLRISYERRCKK